MDSNASSSRKLALTIYENERNTAGRSASGTFEQITKIFTKRVVRADKKGMKGFSPCRLKPDTTRANENVALTSMMVADIDDGTELRYLRSTLAPYQWLAHSSHRHMIEEFEFKHKYRVVIPLTRDVLPEEWSQVWAGFNVMMGGHIDTNTKDQSRFFYLPSCMEVNEEHAFFETHDGAELDPQTLLDLAPAGHISTPSKKGKPKTKNAFGAALETNFPDSHANVVAEHCATVRWFKETGAPNAEPLWHKLVGTLKHCVDGEAKIHEWSAKYEGYDYSETQNKIDLWSVGPALCEVIKGCDGNRCNGCAHTCKTPVQLGHVLEDKPVQIDKLVEMPDFDHGMTTDELVKKVWNPRVRAAKDGRSMTYAVIQDDGTIQHTPFSSSVFYPVDLVKNEEHEWEMVMHYITQYGKEREFRMPTSYLASSDKMAGTLAAHTIFLIGKLGRIFAMDHMTEMVRGLQAHRQEVVTEEAFGWNATGDGLIIGTHEVDAAGKAKKVLMSEHVTNGGLAKDFGVKGTRNDWVRLVDEMFNRPGAEMYQFAFLVSAASPLVEMAGIDGFHGLPIAYTGTGGRGKTTACRLACSIWGKGDNFMRSSNKDGTTINGLLAMTAIYRHLPIIMDEMTGQKTEDISQMLYALSNGQSKTRLTAAGTFASNAARWDLFSFITGNIDITGLLATLDRQQAEAVSVRCFEVKVPEDFNETVFKGVDVKKLVDIELANNYGVVGRELTKVYLKNRAKIVELIHKTRQKYNPRTADETRERFYVDMICFALAAGKVMQKLDLIRFDLNAIEKWAFSNVKLLRRARTERQFTTEDMVGDFISSLHEHTIVTKTIVDMRKGGNPEVPLEQLRYDPLARKATGDKRFIVAAKAFQVWGKENNVSPNAIREALDKSGYIIHITGRDNSGGYNTRLGTGTTRTTGLARCFELDYAKVHGLEKSEAKFDNVVQMPVSKSVAVESEDLGETAVSA